MRIAIIEDNRAEADKLKDLLEKYAKEYSDVIETDYFQNAIIFLEKYKEYDVIFMDIQMPHLDGMKAAEKLREIDTVTPLIFVTNIGSMAVNGYSVGAFAYLTKPVSYDGLVMNMERLRRSLAENMDKKIVISATDGKVCLTSSEIYYIEVQDHTLIYHTQKGRFSVFNTLKNANEQLSNCNFSLCNSCYLVNLKYVYKVKNYTVQVFEDELQISHPRRKKFLEDLNQYIGNAVFME